MAHEVEETEEADREELSPAERAELSRWIVRVGDRAVSEAVGSSRNTVVRAMAGLPVRRGSVALIRDGLEREVRK